MSQELYTIESRSDEPDATLRLRQELIGKLAAEWVTLEAAMNGQDEVLAASAREQAYQEALAGGSTREDADAFANRVYDQALDKAYVQRVAGFQDKIQRQIAIEDVIAMLGGTFHIP